jgi:ATP synthase protein I
MSQASIMSDKHPKHVDPASRTGRGVYNTLSATSVGLEFGLSVIIGLGGGWWLDKELGTGPWLTIVLMCCGFAAGVRGILRAVKRADREAARDKDPNA